MDSVKARVRMGLSIRPAGVIVYEYDRAGIAALEYIPKDMPMVVVGGSFGDGEYQVINAERDGGRWMTMHSAGSRPSHRVPCGASGRSDR